MGHQVVSRFFDRARSVYVDPGAPCPDLAPAEVKRLVEARCLVEGADEAPAAAPPRRKREALGTAEPPAPAE